MSEHMTALIVLIAANIPLYFYLGKLLFDDWDGFGEALGYLFTPDTYSFFRGEGADDFFATFIFHIFLALCAACVYGEFHLLHKYWLH